jgi:hypothetical protein
LHCVCCYQFLPSVKQKCWHKFWENELESKWIKYVHINLKMLHNCRILFLEFGNFYCLSIFFLTFLWSIKHSKPEQSWGWWVGWCSGILRVHCTYKFSWAIVLFFITNVSWGKDSSAQMLRFIWKGPSKCHALLAEAGCEGHPLCEGEPHWLDSSLSL